ncbi:MAG: hypothetical protein KJ587_20315 [Alphaproteobacteria bacterium]|nr:hypothetical protein [Alphaproteobacteria bacterium]
MAEQPVQTIVDEIESAAYPKITKIIRLWAIAMLNYRQPLGDKALDAMRRLTDADATQAIMFLTGFASTTKYEKSQLEELAGIKLRR